MEVVSVLQELAIKNFAIIHDLALSFEKGMTVLTGETGAGKSIIIDAVGLIAGGRGSSEFIRHGAEKCTLEGQFAVEGNPITHALLDKYQIDIEEETLIIQRDIHRSGRNVCRVNGRLVNIATLREIGESLIDIHGQSEHQELMHSERHLNMLDQFGDEELIALKRTYSKTYQEYKEIEKTVLNNQSSEQELAQRVDMLRFQTNEIEMAELTVGEDITLEEEKNLLSNYQKIVESLSAAYEALQGEEYGGIDLAGNAMSALETIEDIDPSYRRISEIVSNSYFQLQEAASDILKEQDQLAYDENRLNEIEKRLETIQQLKRKYGETIKEILDYYEEISIELGNILNRETHLSKLTEELDAIKKELVNQGKQLTRKRKETADQLQTAIQEQLKELYMDKVQFEARFISSKEGETAVYESGLDHVEFYIATNLGEPLKPLARVASGGELSRVMLALKTVFSKTQGITSIIFDEVDTGVSGRVAQAIANKIYKVAVHSQVLCITHLPQVAAMADNHLYISKAIVEDRTETSVNKLKDVEQINELARMLAGTEITKLSIEHAKELKDLADKEKYENVKQK